MAGKAISDGLLWIPHGILGDRLDAVKAELTLEPQTWGEDTSVDENVDDVGNNSEELRDPAGLLQMYEEGENGREGYLGVPRSWGLSKWRSRVDNQEQGQAGPGPVVDESTLDARWETQKPIVDDVVEALQGHLKGGILMAGCGFGKTVSSLVVASRLGLRTAVLVDSSYLLEQWRDRIEQFCGIKAGVIQGDTWEVDSPITIISLDTIVSRGIGDLGYHWGLVITDECHHIAARTWLKAHRMLKAKYRLGLSATPRRKDGLDDALFWELGPIVATGTGNTLKASVKFVIWNEDYVYKRYLMRKARGVVCRRWGKPMVHRPRLIEDITKNVDRNWWIIDNIARAVKQGRHILLLTDRVAHAQALMRGYDKKYGKELGLSGLCVGATQTGKGKDLRKKTMSQEDKEIGMSRQVTFATYHMCREGVDVPQKDTMFCATPVSDMEQAAGRIIRPRPGKKPPLVVDLVDTYPDLVRQASKRNEQYLELGFDVAGGENLWPIEQQLEWNRNIMLAGI